MPAPVALTTEEFAALQALAAPIAFDQRSAFIAAVVEALSVVSHRGPGALHRIAARLQVGYVRTSNRITSEESRASWALSRVARHQAQHANVRAGRATWF